MKSDSRSRAPSLMELTNARIPRRMVRRGRVGAQLPVEPWADEGSENSAVPMPYVGRLGMEGAPASRRNRTLSAPSPVRRPPLTATSKSDRALAYCNSAGSMMRSSTSARKPSPLARAVH
ncbi:hypothetical protein BD626DRAFT_491132 [Schizophyllum amplum]|uniref:Uncharacterized protein n=1 Tax=Schizophyllum amplum TaxID=97359 RepID=A0A550CHD7_9AGAR|nr:hypothetical protein BD626DRAFT_491132 [Auriculariopsis ampla]